MGVAEPPAAAVPDGAGVEEDFAPGGVAIVVEVGAGGADAVDSLSPGGTTDGWEARVDFSNPAFAPRKKARARAASRPTSPANAWTPVNETW